MKKGDKVLVQGQFDGYDKAGNALVSFEARGDVGRDYPEDAVNYFPQVAVKKEFVKHGAL